jgi:rhodanese-related sulfurtransferase
MTTSNPIPASTFVNLLNADSKLKVIDVRTSAEIASERLQNSIHLPLQELTLDSFENCLKDHHIEEADTIYILCGSGMRAKKAHALLTDSSKQNLVVIEGGINALKQLPVTIIQENTGVMSLERQVRIAAGSLVLLGIILGFINPAFLFVSAFVGAGLVFAGVTDNCGMALMLTKMPWNQTNTQPGT